MPNLGLPPSPPSFKPPEELVSERLARTYQTWQELRGARFAPSRKDITPSRFKDVLRDVFLIDVVDDGADFRFALGGDTLVRFLGNRLTMGMLLSTISGSLFHKRAIRAFRECINTKLPVATGPSRATLYEREFLSLEVLVLPLSETGHSVTSLMGAIHISPMPDETAPRDNTDNQPTAFPAEA
jgi:hypothetical protein